MSTISKLIGVLDPTRPVIVQAHDFPDHDAVASAFALSRLLALFEVESTLCYGGMIQSESLIAAIDQLAIPIASCAELEIGEDAQIIIVDGFSGNSNMTSLPGSVAGVIDHHEGTEKPSCPFSDIRTEFGSCATIIFEYYRTSGARMDNTVSTALLMGLMMDTAFMTRGVHQVDLEAFSHLFFKGDWQLASRLLKNSLSLSDLAIFREAIIECTVARDFCYVPLESECSTEVAALVADFFLNLREISFSVVVSSDREEYRISVRSSDPHRPTDVIIRRALDGIGSGGGHMHMGGGSIPRHLYPGDEGLRKRFLVALGWMDKE